MVPNVGSIHAQVAIISRDSDVGSVGVDFRVTSSLLWRPSITLLKRRTFLRLRTFDIFYSYLSKPRETCRLDH